MTDGPHMWPTAAGDTLAAVLAPKPTDPVVDWTGDDS